MKVWALTEQHSWIFFFSNSTFGLMSLSWFISQLLLNKQTPWLYSVPWITCEFIVPLMMLWCSLLYYSSMCSVTFGVISLHWLWEISHRTESCLFIDTLPKCRQGMVHISRFFFFCFWIQVPLTHTFNLAEGPTWNLDEDLIIHAIPRTYFFLWYKYTDIWLHHADHNNPVDAHCKHVKHKHTELYWLL